MIIDVDLLIPVPPVQLGSTTFPEFIAYTGTNASNGSSEAELILFSVALTH
jgi:hypothetical protein